MVSRALWGILIVLVSISEPAFAQARFPYMGRTVADRVVVRTGQHVNFEPAATLQKGEELVVLSESYGWFKVKLPSASPAFVKAEHILLLSPQVGEVKPEKLNVRSAPNTAAPVLGKVEKGKRLYIRENRGEWIMIRPVDSLSGWVKTDLVQRIEKAVPDKLYPEPSSTLTAPPAAAVTPPSVPLVSSLKKADSGKFEAVGRLEKTNAYRVVKDGKVVCLVDGPADVLDAFIGSDVRVLGDVKDPSAAEPVLKLSKVHFNL